MLGTIGHYRIFGISGQNDNPRGNIKFKDFFHGPMATHAADADNGKLHDNQCKRLLSQEFKR